MVSVLLLGGARSGKSLLSERLASEFASDLGLSVTALVTAEPIDAEMQARIERHQADRPPGWSTVEAPYDLLEAVAKVADTEIVVVDCVTVWLTNLLVRGDSPDRIEAEGRALADALAMRSGPGFAVSNEIGLGIVPGDPLSRSFRDIQGRVNQALAATLEYAYLVIAGRLLPLQSSTEVLAALQGAHNQVDLSKVRHSEIGHSQADSE